MKTSIYLSIALIAAFAFSSCNTYIGLSKDIQKLGGAMEHNAYGDATVPPAQ
ncbi:MAG: hypothetical protein ACSHX0_11475 [Akkermansiaceae bacterium]